MRTIRLVLRYEGTAFEGFVPQPGRRTVSGELGKAVARVLGEQVRLTAGGRTDAGVHALGQVASFQTASSLPTEEMKRAFNALIADDMVVAEVVEADAGFDARRDARTRRYEFAVWNEPDRSLVYRRWTVHVPDPLDVEAMDKACQVLSGRHDFASFRTHRTQDDPSRSTVRVVERIGWWRDATDPKLVKFQIEADGFLRHMVRSIVGSALRVGLGKAPGCWIEDVLGREDRAAAGPTAPASGLTLMEITY